MKPLALSAAVLLSWIALGLLCALLWKLLPLVFLALIVFATLRALLRRE